MKVRLIDAKKANDLLQNSKPMSVLAMDIVAEEDAKNFQTEEESEFSLNDLEKDEQLQLSFVLTSEGYAQILLGENEKEKPTMGAPFSEALFVCISK